MAENEGPVVVEDLPISFQVKYLGQSDARGLWGIKHTRKPVDLMVAAAKALPPGQILPIVKLVITVDGVHLESINHSTKRDLEHLSAFFNIESISYGVQDLVYTRVFSMIIVKDNADVKGLNPFECHAFVCESRNAARRLTYALAAAFQDYSRRVKEMQTTPGVGPGNCFGRVLMGDIWTCPSSSQSGTTACVLHDSGSAGGVLLQARPVHPERADSERLYTPITKQVPRRTPVAGLDAEGRGPRCSIHTVCQSMWTARFNQGQELDDRPPSLKKRFAIDLRTPEEIEADLETEA